MGRAATATEKQVRYALHLLGRAGYDTRYMGAQYKRLGAKMSERSGTVDSWLRGLSVTECSDLIDRLRAQPA